jgi:hypothetical protein
MSAAPRACPDCGEQVTGSTRNPLNVTHNAAGLTHRLTCAAQTKELPVTDTENPWALHEVARDRWGRPLIKPENGSGKAVPYTRCTTYVGCLEDTFNLSKWQQRMVAIGLAARPDLLLAVSAHSDDKRRLDGICEEAREAAAASSAATTGTALHRLAERLDRGEDLPVPEAARADLDAYRAATAGIDWLHIETLTVHDGLQVAGTPDRVGVLGGSRAQVYDLKTGGIEYGIGKIAMQLALYARSRLYDVNTGARTDLDVDLDRAVIIHLPAGEGRCDLVEVDIAAGWEAVQLATQVRAWRARKDLARPVAATGLDLLTVEISKADSADALAALWKQHRDAWTDAHTTLAGVRKRQLLVGAA